MFINDNFAVNPAGGLTNSNHLIIILKNAPEFGRAQAASLRDSGVALRPTPGPKKAAGEAGRERPETCKSGLEQIAFCDNPRFWGKGGVYPSGEKKRKRAE